MAKKSKGLLDKLLLRSGASQDNKEDEAVEEDEVLLVREDVVIIQPSIDIQRQLQGGTNVSFFACY